MKVIYDREKQRVPIKSWCEYPEESALGQAIALSNHPAVHSHVALMPDAHAGMGIPIGGVVALNNAISPNMVGVDIGCGMCAIHTGYKLGRIQGKLLRNIRKDILEAIPVGFHHRDPKWIDRTYPDIIKGLDDLDDNYIVDLADDTEGRVDDKKVRAQIGTLGGGNHFIEIQKDQDNEIWVMIHSGSRNIGKQVADLHGKKAVAQCAKWHTSLPDKSLAFLPFDDELGRDYFRAMQFALAFALANRRVMMMAVAEVFAKNKLPWPETWKGDMINIHHNYASIENHGKNVIVHRKGATLARVNTVGIIPGSMGTSSYIVKGLGNPESFTSCSHGAGRRMSRSKAKKTIDISDFRFKMKGIECDATIDHLDEAPQAYKDIDEVMRQQADLVGITTKLSPLAVIKG